MDSILTEDSLVKQLNFYKTQEGHLFYLSALDETTEKSRMGELWLCLAKSRRTTRTKDFTTCSSATLSW